VGDTLLGLRRLRGDPTGAELGAAHRRPARRLVPGLRAEVRAAQELVLEETLLREVQVGAEPRRVQTLVQRGHRIPRRCRKFETRRHLRLA